MLQLEWVQKQYNIDSTTVSAFAKMQYYLASLFKASSSLTNLAARTVPETPAMDTKINSLTGGSSIPS